MLPRTGRVFTEALAQRGNPCFQIEIVDAHAREIEGWPVLRPLEDPELPTFPTASLPTWLRDWVEAQSEALQVPPDLPGLLSLSILATACAQRFHVEVRDGWLEPVNLYVLVALPSGARKSVVFEAATAPLLAFELAQMESAEQALSTLGGAAVEQGLRLVVASDRDEPARAEALPRRVFVSDATPERVATLLAENAGRLAVLSDEGEICSVIAGRYGGSFEVFLKAHSGQVVTIERQGRDRVHVRRPALTLGLAVQPDVLEHLVGKRAICERGLLARFLVAVPRSRVGFRRIAPPAVPELVTERYAANVRALLEQPEETDSHGDIVRTGLRLSSEAHEVFTAAEARVERQLRPEGALGSIPSWGSKLPGAVARISGLLAVAEDPDTDHVPVRAVEAAIALGEYLTPHALASFGHDMSGEDLAAARTVLGWIRRKGQNEFTRRAVQQALRSQFPRAQDIDEPLQVLEGRGFIRDCTTAGETGRPSRRFEVRPDFGCFESSE